MAAVYLIIGIIAYLIGSISFGIILSKKMAGIDVREKGSQSSGATNVLRTVGKKAAALTLLFDILKGVVAVIIAVIAGLIWKDEVNRALLVQIAGIAVILGHTFPIYFGFKGGKGIATGIGILLVTNWQIGLICLIFGVVLIVLTRMVSVGSLAASILFPILTIFIPGNYLVEGNYIIFGIIVACITTYNHRKNIERLLNGTENKLGGKKEK